MATLQQIKNELTKNSTILRHAVFGADYIGSDGKVHNIDPDEITGRLHLSGITGGGTVVNPDNPDTGQSDGDNYRAGSLEDGEITDTNLLWQGPSDATRAVDATMIKDVGAKFNMVGDGIMITAHIVKTIMTKGVKGAVSILPIVYSAKNTPEAGYYVSTSSYPAFVLASHFVVGTKLNVPFNGIGEDLKGKNIKSPMVHLTFHADKTLTIENETGYNNDGDTAGATGVNYDVVVDLISTYSSQYKVTQLPAGISVFNGDASGTVALSAVNDFFTNVPGLYIELDDNIDISQPSPFNTLNYYGKLEDFGLPSYVSIPKEQLINGMSSSLSLTGVKTSQITMYSYRYGDKTSLSVDVNTKSSRISISSDKYIYLNVDISFNGKGALDGNNSLIVKIKSIKTWKER